MLDAVFRKLAKMSNRRIRRYLTTVVELKGLKLVALMFLKEKKPSEMLGRAAETLTSIVKTINTSGE